MLSISPQRSPSPSLTPSRPRQAAALTCCCHTYTGRDAVGGHTREMHINETSAVVYQHNCYSVFTVDCFFMSCGSGTPIVGPRSTKEVNIPHFMDAALKHKVITAEKGICLVSASGNSLTKCGPLTAITLLTVKTPVVCQSNSLDFNILDYLFLIFQT